MKETLDALADIAAITTALVAVLFYAGSQIGRYNRRHGLQALLRCGPTLDDGRPPRRSVAELRKELWLSEAEVFEAARNNPYLERGLNSGQGAIEDRLWLRWQNSN